MAIMLREQLRRPLPPLPEDSSKQYLYPGTYRLYCINKRYYWKKEKRFSKWLKDILSDSSNTLKKKLKILLFAESFSIRKENVSACGDELYITRKGQLKVFDHDEGVVHFFTEDEEVIERARHFWTNYAPYFDKQIISAIDDRKRCITERYIIECSNWRKKPDEVKKITDRVWDSILNYVKAKASEKSMLNVPEYIDMVVSSCDDTDLTGVIREIGLNIPNDLEPVPIIFQHNDMVLSNILVENDGITVFDYEFYGRNIFYYDALMFIMWQALHYKEDLYLSRFLAGDYDAFFRTLFDAVGCEYVLELKKDYCKLFLLANIDMHIKTGDKTNLEKYRRVLDILRH